MPASGAGNEFDVEEQRAAEESALRAARAPGSGAGKSRRSLQSAVLRLQATVGNRATGRWVARERLLQREVSWWAEKAASVHSALAQGSFVNYPDGAFWIINPLNDEDRAKIMNVLEAGDLDRLVEHGAEAEAAGVPNAADIVAKATRARKRAHGPQLGWWEQKSAAVHVAIHQAKNFVGYPDGAFWIINPLNETDRAKLMTHLDRGDLEQLIAHRQEAETAGVPNAKDIVDKAFAALEATRPGKSTWWGQRAAAVHSAVGFRNFAGYPDGAFWVIDPLNDDDRGAIMGLLDREDLDALVRNQPAADAAQVPNGTDIVEKARAELRNRGFDVPAVPALAQVAAPGTTTYEQSNEDQQARVRGEIEAMAVRDIRARWPDRKTDFIAVAMDVRNNLTGLQMFQIWLHYWIDEQAAAYKEFHRIDDEVRRAQMNRYLEQLPRFNAGLRGVLPADWEAAADRLNAANYYTSDLEDVRWWLEAYVDNRHEHVTLHHVNVQVVELIKRKQGEMMILGAMLIIASVPATPRGIAPPADEPPPIKTEVPPVKDEPPPVKDEPPPAKDEPPPMAISGGDPVTWIRPRATPRQLREMLANKFDYFTWRTPKGDVVANKAIISTGENTPIAFGTPEGVYLEGVYLARGLEGLPYGRYHVTIRSADFHVRETPDAAEFRLIDTIPVDEGVWFTDDDLAAAKGGTK